MVSDIQKKHKYMLVSAIVPTYNRANMLGKTIDSIINQTYQDMEIIIVDDGSTDNTENIVNKYINKYRNKIRYIKKENGGCASARNLGVDIASGSFIAFLDSDDQWLPDAIDSMMKTLLRTGADFVYSPTIQISLNNKNEIIYPAAKGYPHHFAVEHFLTNEARSCAILYKRHIFNRLRSDESLKYNEDSDFLQKVALSFKAAYLPEPTAKVFTHKDNKSSDRVSIYKALLNSSERILFDFPEFKKELGKAADTRIFKIKELLVEALINNNSINEAISSSRGIKNKLRTDLRLSLVLKSSLPFKLTHTIKKIQRLLYKIIKSN